MLTRIYGTAFATKDELAEHLQRLEEARKRDHRKLGQELELFLFNPVSPGSPFWLPNGMAIWNELTKLWRTENGQRGYKEVKTPILYSSASCSSAPATGTCTARTCTSRTSRATSRA